jgi:ABC-type multidrug transport system ATPase subunit
MQPVSEPAAIAVRGLSKRYPAPWSWARLSGGSAAPPEALRDVTFQLAPGEVLALIGPNGSGKSTLLRILAGLLLPTRGDARVAELDVVRDRPASRARVGTAWGEDRGLSSRLSVRENLRFFGALYGLSSGRVAERIAALARQLESTALLDRPVRTLSGGERARAALMRALLHAPKVLLLDEVTRSLDPGAGARIRAWLLDEAKRSGLAMVIASHDLSEVAAMAGRVLVLDAGATAALGPWDEVRAAAQSVFARSGAS